MSDAFIQIKNLKKYFRVKTGAFGSKLLKAVDDLSLDIKKGEIMGLVGESGCGKTTAGRTILRLYEPTSGSVIYDGREVGKDMSISELRRCSSMVFQDPYSSLDPRMTVSDIIGEPLDVQGRYSNKNERSEKILSIMNRVGLNSEHASRYAHEFSGGQRQRVGIARALVTEPSFLVCDEPVSALDVSIQAQIINMFEDLQREMDLTMLFIAHDILVVRHICDRIAVMYLGHLMELADADMICDKPLHPYTMSLMSSVPIPDPHYARDNRQVRSKGEIPSPLDMPAGCPFHTRCPWAKDICSREMPALKEKGDGRFVACHDV